MSEEFILTPKQDAILKLMADYKQWQTEGVKAWGGDGLGDYNGSWFNLVGHQWRDDVDELCDMGLLRKLAMGNWEITELGELLAE